VKVVEPALFGAGVRLELCGLTATPKAGRAVLVTEKLPVSVALPAAITLTVPVPEAPAVKSRVAESVADGASDN